MKLEGPGERLSIFIGESDQHDHRPLYTEIVHRAHDAGLAGATVVRGFEGFGASSRIHTSRILRLSEDLPVVVIIVDQPERIDAFLPALDELITEGLVVREYVEIVKYVGRPAGT
jgi:PII-like signaling protein